MRAMRTARSAAASDTAGMESVLKVPGESRRQSVHPGLWNPLAAFDAKGFKHVGPDEVVREVGSARHNMDVHVLVEWMLSELGQVGLRASDGVGERGDTLRIIGPRSSASSWVRSAKHVMCRRATRTIHPSIAVFSAWTTSQVGIRRMLSHGGAVPASRRHQVHTFDKPSRPAVSHASVQLRIPICPADIARVDCPSSPGVRRYRTTQDADRCVITAAIQIRPVADGDVQAAHGPACGPRRSPGWGEDGAREYSCASSAGSVEDGRSRRSGRFAEGWLT